MNNKFSLIIIAAISLGLAGICSAQTSRGAADESMAPYTEGPVWTITMVRSKAGMTDDYLKNLAGAFKRTSDEMKKEGIILDYKILLGDASNPQDYDILLMTEFKNMAEFDNLRAKTDAIERKLIGTETQMREGSVKRAELREILGDKMMREITLK
jgi:hypothetical protein